MFAIFLKLTMVLSILFSFNCSFIFKHC